MKLFRAGMQHNEQPRRRTHSNRRTTEQVATSTGQRLFSRNATLVGSVSLKERNADASLHSDMQSSSRTHVHHLTAYRRSLMKVLVFVVSGACALVWILYNFTVYVDVAATDTVSIDDKRYKNAINDYFAGHPIERLRFALNTEGLSEYLSQTVPEVVGVEMGGSSGFASTHFDIIFRQPLASWKIAQTQYYVDQDGVSFTVNYFERPTVQVIDNSGVPQSAGATIASSRFLRFVGRTVSIARASNMIIKEAIIPANTTHQIEVIVKGHAYPIKLSLDRPVGEQIEDMQNAIRYFAKHRITPKYVDIRVSGVAFYR
ncbi:hypothetical protein KC953_02325 [Candidatus Saccharibacteria bacterium]|nr:hypothetical protein [Candidatus Saccharibacteria bacterium]